MTRSSAAVRRDSKARVAVLASGRGSNLRALAEACMNPAFPACIAAVFSDNPASPALDFAREIGAAAFSLTPKGFPNRKDYDRAVTEILKRVSPEIICMAGYMRLVTPEFLSHWPESTLNIHPSLLPLFKGLHAQRQALEAGVKITGCTVHLVTPDMDAGPIVVQRAVSILESDDEASLAARILQQEHVAYPEALRLLALGKVSVAGHKTVIST